MLHSHSLTYELTYDIFANLNSIPVYARRTQLS